MQSRGGKLSTHDFTDRKEMQFLVGKAESFGLPRTFNSHMFTFVERPGTTLVLLGHLPRPLLDQALDLPGLPSKLVLQQEEMHMAPQTYDLWPFTGQVKTLPLALPLDKALALQEPPKPAKPGPAPELNPAPRDVSPAPEPGVLPRPPVSELQDVSPAPEAGPTPRDVSPVLLPTVVIAGLADGINPCAFAVMAFFTAVLFALRRTRQHILKLGAAYIAAMYATYFALGLGLLRGLEFIGQPHLVMQGGAVFVIVLGLIQVKDSFLPGLPLHLTIPKPGWELIQSWAKRANIPAALVVGGLVGLCTLPCSGGIYVAILALLISQTTFTGGLGYLGLYNLMFISPLIAILLVISSRPMSLALAGWERGHTRSLHAGIGVGMIALGVFMLGWLH